MLAAAEELERIAIDVDKFIENKYAAEDADGDFGPGYYADDDERKLSRMASHIHHCVLLLRNPT